MRAPKSTVGRARALRRELTFPEISLWQMLRGRRPNGARFRRQHLVGPYVLDFYCSDARLAIEVDGAAHDHPDIAARDAVRDHWLTERDIAVVRFPARDLLTENGRQPVLATIAVRLAAPSTALRAVPLPRSTGEGQPRRPPQSSPAQRWRPVEGARAGRCGPPSLPSAAPPAYNAPVPG